MDFKLFAERVKEARKRAGLNQAELAEKLGVGQNTVSNYENATGNKGSAPKLETAAKIAEILNVSLDWLVGCNTSDNAGEIMTKRALLNGIIGLAENGSIEMVETTAFENFEFEHAFYGVGFWLYGTEAKMFSVDLKNFLNAEKLLRDAGLSDDMNKAAIEGLRKKLLDKYSGLFEATQREKKRRDDS